MIRRRRANIRKQWSTPTPRCPHCKSDATSFIAATGRHNGRRKCKREFACNACLRRFEK